MIGNLLCRFGRHAYPTPKVAAELWAAYYLTELLESPLAEELREAGNSCSRCPHQRSNRDRTD